MECRLCLGSHPNNRIFNFDSEIVLNILSLLQIELDDGLPELICDNCVIKLSDIEDFINICKESNFYLRSNYEVEIKNEPSLDVGGDTINLDRELVVVLDNNLEQLLEDIQKNKAIIMSKRTEKKMKQGPQIFICEKCNKTFTNELAFKKHSKEHNIQITNDKEFCMCGFCLKRFISEDELNQHYTQKHECSFCRRLFTDRHHHERKYHNRKSLLCECEHCGKVFKNSFQLETHVKFRHTKFECDICNKVWYNKHLLRRHMRTHLLGSSNYKCGYCMKLFKRRESLYVHVQRFHLKTKPRVSCTVCNKSYLTKGNLKEHMLIHKGEKKYQCDHCSETYFSKNNLSKHIQYRHLGNVSYSCRKCKRRFSTVKYRNYHEETHNDSPLYKCPVCSKEFDLKPSFRFHLKNKHKNINSSEILKGVVKKRNKKLDTE